MSEVFVDFKIEAVTLKNVHMHFKLRGCMRILTYIRTHEIIKREESANFDHFLFTL
jgi:hypothetical protein